MSIFTGQVEHASLKKDNLNVYFYTGETVSTEKKSTLDTWNMYGNIEPA